MCDTRLRRYVRRVLANARARLEDGGWDFADGETNEMARDVAGRGGEEEDGHGDGAHPVSYTHLTLPTKA